MAFEQGPSGKPQNPEQDRALRLGRSWFWWALLAISGLAIAIRLYHLDTYPLGLFWDEAVEGIDAYSLFGKPVWQWPLFFTAINGREPLFVYLVHLAQRLDGPTAWAVRIVSALCGALLTPALAWLGWEVAPALQIERRKSFALWCGTAVLALLWSQMLARLGQRITLFILLETLFFAALWRGWRTCDRKWWMTAGVFAGISFYSYLAVRVVPVLLVLLLGYALLFRRPALRRRTMGMAIGLATGIVVAAPLLIHFALNPGHFSMRTSQIDILTHGGFADVFANAGRVLAMAFVRGDLNDRLNIPGRPVLDAILVLPFLAGLYSAVRRPGRGGRLFLLAGLVCMLLPTLLSAEAPNFGRAAGALPFFALSIALGFDRLTAWSVHRRPGWQPAGAAAVWVLLLISVTLTARAYYVEYTRYRWLAEAWDTGYTLVAYDMAGVTAGDIYVEKGLLDHPTVEYLLSGRPPELQPQVVQSDSGCIRIPTQTPGRYYAQAGADSGLADRLAGYLPDAKRRVFPRWFPHQVEVDVLEQPAGGAVRFPEMRSLPQTFEDGIQLLGYTLSDSPAGTPEQGCAVRFFWQATAQPSYSYTVFIHLNSDGSVVIGKDELPGEGICPTSDWLPGEATIYDVLLPIPADLANGAYDITIGMYRLETMQRLQAAGSSDGQVVLGRLVKDGSGLHCRVWG